MEGIDEDHDLEDEIVSGMADADDTDLGVRSIMNIKYTQAEYKHAWIYAVLKFSGPLTPLNSMAPTSFYSNYLRKFSKAFSPFRV